MSFSTSAPRKRAISSTAPSAPAPDHSKRLKSLWDSNHQPGSSEDLKEENAFLKSQLAALVDFVDAKGFAADAPPSLVPLFVSRVGPKSLSTSLKKKMAAVASPLFNKSYNHRKTGVTNDDLARAMSDFIEPVRKVAQLDHPDALEEAYNLAFEIKVWWFNEESTSYEPDGISDWDPDLDALITDLIHKRKEAGHCWGWKAELERLDAEAKSREEMGTERWLIKTREALKRVVDELGDGEEGAPAPPRTDAASAAVLAGGLSDLESNSDDDELSDQWGESSESEF